MKKENIPAGLLIVLITALIFATAAWILLVRTFENQTGTLKLDVKNLEKVLSEKADLKYEEFFVEFCRPVCDRPHASGIRPEEWNTALIDEKGKGVFYIPYDPQRVGLELIKHWSHLSTSSGWDEEPVINTEQEDNNLVVRVTTTEMTPGWVGVIVSSLTVVRPVDHGY